MVALLLMQLLVDQICPTYNKREPSPHYHSNATINKFARKLILSCVRKGYIGIKMPKLKLYSGKELNLGIRHLLQT